MRHGLIAGSVLSGLLYLASTISLIWLWIFGLVGTRVAVAWLCTQGVLWLVWLGLNSWITYNALWWRPDTIDKPASTRSPR